MALKSAPCDNTVILFFECGHVQMIRTITPTPWLVTTPQNVIGCCVECTDALESSGYTAHESSMNLERIRHNRYANPHRMAIR